MKHTEEDCASFRERLSARRDGELADEPVLDAHLSACPACRQHERTLSRFDEGFRALREPSPLPDLWGEIERRARPRPIASYRLRVAAALVGFIGLGGAVLFVQNPSALPPANPHLLERLLQSTEPETVLASVPELHLLQTLTSTTARQGSDSR